MSILERIELRLTDEQYDEALLDELAEMITDRLCLRLHTDTLPDRFSSIVVDASVKAWRRRFYEGITSENGSSNVTVSFVDDLLAEYEAEIAGYTDAGEAAAASGKVVRFL